MFSGEGEFLPVSWRGDGKYFATMSDACGSGSLLKKIKVWDRDSGDLLASSELRSFAGAVLEWMPSGAKIAAVCDGKDGNESPSVVFFSFVSTLCVVLLYSRHVLCVLVISVRLLVFHFVD